MKFIKSKSSTIIAIIIVSIILSLSTACSNNDGDKPTPREHIEDNSSEHVIAIAEYAWGDTDITDIEIEVNSERVQFAIREATFDGTNVFIAVEVKPTNPDLLVLALDATEFDYPDTVGKTFIRTYVRVPTRDGVFSGDYFIEDDGTFIFNLNFLYEDDSPAINLELICGIILNDATDSENIDFIDLEELQKTLTVDEYNELVSEILRNEEERITQNPLSNRVESTLFVTVLNSGYH